MKFTIRQFVVAAVLASMVLAAIALIPGCTNRISGDTNENIPPNVWFVNVPPKDNTSSKNPIINWVGQDIDGQVVRFRFVVLTEEELADTSTGIWYEGTPPTVPISDNDIQAFVDSDSGLMKLSDTLWTALEVDPVAGDPKTSNIIPMSAELDDPVNVFVRQFVFVQAFDEEGAASKVAFRAFQRNDNPPDTRIIGFLGGPFINAIQSTGSIAGIRMRWEGSDVIDFPTDPPPFEYEWRLYGPYFKNFQDTLNDSTWDRVQDNFIKTVFVTRDARVFRKGEGAEFEDCDTTFLDTMTIIQCDTIAVDTITSANIYGNLDTIFDIQDPNFANDPLYNRIAKQSHDVIDGDEWISGQRDSVFDAYEFEPSDTTQEQYFVFWVRSRDDAKVPDITPAFVTFTVIDPQYERDVGVVDVQFSFSINARRLTPARAYWVEALANWAASSGLTINYSDSIDYLKGSTAEGIGVRLRQLLARKVLIVMNDEVMPGLMANPTFQADLFTAVSTGVNVWMLGRNHIFGGEGAPPNFDYWETLPAVLRTNMSEKFGVQRMVYSGWSGFLFGVMLPTYGYPPGTRIEDFIGTLSLDEQAWPSLSVDTALLHANYDWGTAPWRDTIAAYPEVNWMVRSPGTEVLHLYKSRFGSRHPVGVINNTWDFSFQGKPVAIRLNTGVYRTAYFMFGPYGMTKSSMQTTINNLMDWLYDKYLDQPVSGIRYPDARHPISMEQVRRSYQELMQEKALQDPDLAETFR
jgi:hypothetical protein